MEQHKDVPLEELPKEELVKKCKRLLLLAQKAKAAKDESSEELKKSKDAENKLRAELSAVQEVLQAAEERHEMKQEAVNTYKILETQNAKLQAKLSAKNEENLALQKVLENLNAKISVSEIHSSETYSSLMAENDDLKSKCLEYQTKLKNTEEKFALLEVKLVEFQNTYLEEKKKHEKLESLLGKLEEKADKTGSDRSESRDGLATVNETEEVESLALKLEETVKKWDQCKIVNENYQQKIEIIEKELNDKNMAHENLLSAHNILLEKCLERCQQFSIVCKTATDEIVCANENARKTKCELDIANNRILELEEREKSLQTLVNQSNQTQNENSRQEILELNSVIEGLNNQLQMLRKENAASDTRLFELENRLAESTKMSETLEASVNKHCDEYKNFKIKVEAYENIVPKLQTLWGDVKSGKEFLNALRTDVSSQLLAVVEEHAGIGENVTQVVKDFARKLADSNAELLSEMNEMNQALKERGETISKLEQTNAELKSNATDHEMKYKILSDKSVGMQDEVGLLRTQLEEKDKGLREMEEELWRVRNAEAAGDTLSTSTISRVEDSQRLADLDGSFEERYNKLKALAVKLKRKVLELQTLLDQERAKLVGERAYFQTQTKAFSSLQSEYDALLDKNEAERKEMAENRKSLIAARDEATALQMQVDEFKHEKNRFAQEKSTFDMIKKELTGQIQNLKKSLEKEQGKIRQWESEKIQWENDVKNMEKKLADEKERHKATMVHLEEERHKQKKQSLLSLEMADYERTVTEMSKKLSANEDQIKELTANLETQRELSKTLQESVNNLESRVLTEQTTTDASKATQNALQDELAKVRGEWDSLTSKMLDAERLAMDRSLEVDALRLELSTSVAEGVKNEEKWRLSLDRAKTEIRTIEHKRAQAQNLLERRELELEELGKEFESYKVRAQSVLRQSQRDGLPGRQLDTEQELVQLRASYEGVRVKLEEEHKNGVQVKNQLAHVTEEKGRLQNKVQELQKEVKELKLSNTQLEAAEQRARDAGDEALRMARVQQDTLAQCYMREIEGLKSTHTAELETCRQAQQQAELALQLHVKSPSSPPTHRRMPSGGGFDNSHRRNPSAGFVPVRNERDTLDVLMLEREACEGSESVDSSSPRIIPLEQLLQPQPPAMSQNVTQLSERLEKSESRIQHLTSLLSDAESDAARLQQLNQVLKEEIRRKERNVAREEHASNLEYLKNIVIKFATLPRGDERLRLVPVLNTILKLSREEEHRLSAAARGDAPNASWGSYLGGMWQGS